MSIIVKCEPRVAHLHASLIGQFSLESACGALRTIIDIGDSHGLNKILMDCQGVAGSPTQIEYYRFGLFAAEEMLKPRNTGLWRTVHLAVFGPEPPLDKGRLAHVVATNRGASTISATNLEAALGWLAAQ